MIATQPQINYNDIFIPSWMSGSQKVGLEGEVWVVNQLRRRGYQADLTYDYFAEQKDIVINGQLPCEVKTSRVQLWNFKRPNKMYNYTRWAWKLSGLTRTDAVLVLLAIDNLGRHYPYVLPSAVMADRAGFQIVSHPDRYNGIIKPDLNNWSVVDYLLNQQYKNDGQLELFLEDNHA